MLEMSGAAGCARQVLTADLEQKILSLYPGRKRKVSNTDDVRFHRHAAQAAKDFLGYAAGITKRGIPVQSVWFSRQFAPVAYVNTPCGDLYTAAQVEDADMLVGLIPLSQLKLAIVRGGHWLNGALEEAYTLDTGYNPSRRLRTHMEFLQALRTTTHVREIQADYLLLEGVHPIGEGECHLRIWIGDHRQPYRASPTEIIRNLFHTPRRICLYNNDRQ